MPERSRDNKRLKAAIHAPHKQRRTDLESAIEKGERHGFRSAKIRRAKSQLLALKGDECSFWFIKAEVLRTGAARFAGAANSLPRLQDLQRDHPDWLVKETLSMRGAARHEYVGWICAVSHRWEKPKEPDPEGLQHLELCKYLQRHTDIELVWYDFWCMPQGGDRSAEEKADFKLMLMNVNLLYLGSSVLVLQELSYLSRFWTQFEAWLSMQLASPEGLAPAPLGSGRRRCEVVTYLNATPVMGRELVQMWSDKSVEEARKLLSRNDVTVTNQSDKDGQLEKLSTLSESVRKALRGSATRPVFDQIPGIAHHPASAASGLFAGVAISGGTLARPTSQTRRSAIDLLRGRSAASSRSTQSTDRRTTAARLSIEPSLSLSSDSTSTSMVRLPSTVDLSGEI